MFAVTKIIHAIKDFVIYFIDTLLYDFGSQSFCIIDVFMVLR